MKKHFTALLIALILALLPAKSYASEFFAKVIGVSDGDTITILTPQKDQIKVRLAEIDAPEKSQPYGEASKQFLSGLVFGKEVTIESAARDKYGRTIARVFVDGIDINLELVRTGHAWAYRQYLSDKTILAAEREAQAMGAGLWALQEDQRIPPWEWRNGGEAVKPPPSPIAHEGSAGFSCAGKRYCREMTSCAEAKFYLSTCGLTRLDGDGDGIPCEKICR